MKYLIAMLLVMNFSMANEIDPYDEISGGDENIEYAEFNNVNVHRRINEEMEVVCGKKGLCTIFALDNDGYEFNTSFNVYEMPDNSRIFNGGPNNNYNNGNNNNNNNFNNPPTNNNGGLFVGITISYTKKRCKQTIQVPKALYISMNTYLYNLMTENGEARRGLTPAHEALMIFYTTIMKQAKGCNF